METPLIFTIFVSLSRSRPICVLYTILYLCPYMIYFVEYVLIFFDDNMDEGVKIFQTANVQPQGVA